MSTAIAPVTHSPLSVDPDEVLRIIAKRTFATLSTVSSRGSPHNAGVLYAMVGRDLYVSTELGTRKARNIASESRVAVAIPIRRVPLGPPALVHFQSEAELLALDDPHIGRLVRERRPRQGHLTRRARPGRWLFRQDRHPVTDQHLRSGDVPLQTGP